MGGDDLDNDDYDYLVQEVKDSAVDELMRMREAADVKNDSKNKQQRNNKRKQEESSSQHDEAEQEKESSNSKKKKSKSSSSSSSSPETLLLEASRSLQTTEQQAAFLSASLRHYSLTTTNQDPEISLDAATHFVASDKATLVERLKDCISSKKLKNKNKNKMQNNRNSNVASPTVVIICQSARRAVAILKECAALNMRVAKLFPKNGSVESQLAQLRNSTVATTPFGLAVGTPHRLQQLCQAEHGLSFSKTQLVVLDCHASPKGFTVCTLPDTAPHTMSLLRDYVVPELLLFKKERGHKDNIRLAFL